MKLTNRNVIVHLIMVVFLALTFSCSKDGSSSKKDPIITWSIPADINFGTLLSGAQLNAFANIIGSFVYTPTIGTKLNEGANQNLRVDFTPSDAASYNTVSKIVKINVIASKINPVITWVTPVDITLGTRLSIIQLNASANVPGTFVYTPPIDTRLSLGKDQDLKVDFTPTNEAAYKSMSNKVKINVIDIIVFNPNKTYGTMQDQEGNSYKTIIIGTQTWMAQNLKTTKYRNGDQISNTKISETLTSGAYFYDEFFATYGAYYNWYAVNDSRNIAPAGWHVPSLSEWETLITFLGGYSLAGGNLKEGTFTHWWDNIGGYNSSGFTALPAGGIDGMGLTGWFWSSTPFEGKAYSLELHDKSAGVNLDCFFSYKWNGLSVRCIKN